MSNRNSIINCSLLLILLITSSTALAQKFGKITDDEWRMGPPEAYPEANSIIIFHKAEMEVTLDLVEIKYHVRMKVLTQAGIDEIAENEISFYEKYDKIKHFKAHTISPEGRKSEVKKDAVFEKMVGDWKHKVFTFPSVEPGCILEYKYTYKSERHWYLKPWFFQNNVYTLKSQISVCLVPGFSYDVDFRNVSGRYRQAEVTRRVNPSASGGMSHMEVYTWTIDNLMPINDEPYMASINDYRSAIYFQIFSFTTSSNSTYTYVKGWPDVGDQFESFLKGYRNKQGTVEEIAREVTAAASTPREKSEAIFKHVASAYRTTSERPTSWFEHKKLSTLIEEKHGHGEGKNILLVQMHQAIGLDSWPVLISTRDNSRFNPKFPSDRQFNYLLCFVQFDDGWEFLDAAVEHSPYGLLPPNCLADGGLLIDGNNSDLVRMTIKPVQSSRSDVTKMYVAADGAVTCSTLSSFDGYYAARYGEMFDRTEPLEFIQKRYMKRVDGQCTLGDHKCGMDSTYLFTTELNYNTDGHVRMLDNNLLVNPIEYAFTSNPFKSEKRFFPVDFVYPFSYLNRVEIYPESKMTGSTLPENLALEIGGAKYQRKSIATDSSVIVTSLLTIEESEFKQFKYKSLRDFFDQIALATEDEVAILLEQI